METDEETLRLPYSQRPDWADVSPIFVDDGNCVVAVQYTAEHRDALSYFRAVLNSGEKSERVLQLTGDMIGFNQADYTAWQWRWLCVEALGSDLQIENELTQNIMTDNAKNYQLWNHRRKCALLAGQSAAATELEFAAVALDIDEKNYHAWAHRMAVIQAFGLVEQELEFAEQMISRDVRNNSAWNQRAFIVKTVLEKQTDRAEALQKLLHRELAYVSEQILRAPRNDSSWSYLLGLFALPGCHKQEMARWPQVHNVCVAALAEVPSCPCALEALAEYYVTCAEAAVSHVAALQATSQGQVDLVQEFKVIREASANAASLLDGLTFADPVRNMYWIHRNDILQHVLATFVSDDAMVT